MKAIKKISMLAAGIFVLSVAESRGQHTSPALDYDPTPKALEMTRYGNLQIDKTGGRITFDIPLYTYDDKDFSIPVGLSYASNGFRPGSQTGEAGLGWTLAAGGAVTREIIGGDDFKSSGMFSSGGRTDPATLYSMDYSVGYPCIDDDVLYPYISDWHETTSDIYHFTMPGHSGSFLIGNDGEFHAYGTSDGLGTYDISYERSSIRIITGDGYEYRFGSTALSREILVGGDPISSSSPNSLPDRQKPVVTWLLDTIIAPDGRFVTFDYESNGIEYPKTYPDPVTHPDVVTSVAACLGRHIRIGQNPDVTVFKTASLKYTAYLSGIAVHEPDSVTTFAANFEWAYEQGSEMGDEDWQPYTKLAVPTRKLASATFSDTGRRLRRASLAYRYDGCRPLLASVDFGVLGKYEMEYISDPTHPLPGLTSNGVDYWGFYNGKDGNSDSFMNSISSVNDEFNETIPQSHTQMDPDWHYSRLGTLSSVKYPTGGRTTFAIEANTASHILLRRRHTSGGVQPANPYLEFEDEDEISDSFLPGVYPWSAMLHSSECGGVRVASVTDYDAVGGTSTRTFTYQDGLVQTFPRYYVGNTIPGSTALVAIPSLSFPASSLDRLHVSYGKVTETMPDGSRILSEYTDWMDEPDSYSTNRRMMSDPDTGNSEDFNIFLDNRLREPDSRHYRRGLLKRQRNYSPEDVLLSDKSVTYQDVGSGYASYIVGSGRYWWSARRFICDVRPISETSSEYYSGASPLITTKVFAYDSRGRKTSETIEHSDGTTEVNCTVFMDRGYRHDLVSSQSILGKRAYEDTLRLHESASYTYSHPSGTLWNLTGFTRTQYDASGSGTTADELSFSNFDAFGNPWQQTFNGVNTAFVWGHRGRYMSAKVLGCTYAGLPGSVKTVIPTNLTDGMKTALRNLSGKETTIYDHIPSIGASSITGPSGRSLSYEYDGVGRLVNVTSSLGAIAHYTYGIMNRQDTLRYVESTLYGQPDRTERTVYDGLGRPWITSEGVAGHLRISLRHYDECGVEDRRYLPYSALSLNVQSPIAMQRAWWNEESDGEGAYAFEESGYDNCLAPRATWSRLPGSAMSGDAGLTTTTVSTNSAGEVADLRYDESEAAVLVAGTVASGKLLRTKTDGPDGKITVIFTDAAGRTVLERQGEGDLQTDTYYVYDFLGRPVMVVTPELGYELTRDAAAGVQRVIAVSNSGTAGKCFIYEYDGRGNRSGTGVPGAGMSTSGFDARHLPTSTVPSLFDRTMLSRTFSYDSAGHLTSAKLDWSAQLEVDPEPGLPPLLASPVHRTWNLGSYTYSGGDLVAECQHVVDTTFLLPGLHPVIGNIAIVDNPVSSAHADKTYTYDSLGRVTEARTEWPDGAESRIVRTYDKQGKVLSETESYSDSRLSLQGHTLWARTQNTYDAFGNCTESLRQAGTGTPDGGTTLLSTEVHRQYDAIGRLKRTTVSDGGGSVATDLGYTVQGWLSSSNTSLDGEDVFTERLRYWNPVKAADGARHDGNVSEAEFTHGENGSRTEAYSYDALGRITGTRAYLGSSSVATTGFTEGGISYSRNGDILSLKRYGAAGLSENLGYAYNSSGQLYSVRDTVAGSTKTFQFDSAGNLTSDGYESGKEYMYNVLGKLSSVMAPEPGIFSLDRVETAKYIYLADGTKIGVSLPDGSETMYRGPFILHRDADGDVELQTLILPEGIAVPDQNSMKMYIFVTDRLGSTRAVVDLGEREVCEENDYYAFGSRIPGGEQLIENRWRYSGKEEQEALSDLPYIDFGARLYNPRLGRWLSPDPLAEKYYSRSPYNFCGNDPVNKYDPDGRDVWNIDSDGNISRAKHTRREVVRTVDTNSKVINRISIKGANLSVGNIEADGNEYQYFMSSNDKATKRLFEFVSRPSSWGRSNNSSSTEEINESSVLYTNLGNAVLLGENGRVPTASLAVKYIEQGAIFSRIDHVHPGNNPEPSGTGQRNGDIGTILFLDEHSIRFSTPEYDRYHIFTPEDKSYHAYDLYTTLMINESIVTPNSNCEQKTKKR